MQGTKDETGICTPHAFGDEFSLNCEKDNVKMLFVQYNRTTPTPKSWVVGYGLTNPDEKNLWRWEKITAGKGVFKYSLNRKSNGDWMIEHVFDQEFNIDAKETENKDTGFKYWQREALNCPAS